MKNNWRCVPPAAGASGQLCIGGNFAQQRMPFWDISSTGESRTKDWIGKMQILKGRVNDD
ncbi:MAG: hypothetical protein LUC50_02595 [Ruminococcus sp.]|nr:hypothetical protein [Ruminococcus sp.]